MNCKQILLLYRFIFFSYTISLTRATNCKLLPIIVSACGSVSDVEQTAGTWKVGDHWHVTGAITFHRCKTLIRWMYQRSSLFFFGCFSPFVRGAIYGESKCSSLFPSDSKCHRACARAYEIDVIDVYIRGKKDFVWKRTVGTTGSSSDWRFRVSRSLRYRRESFDAFRNYPNLAVTVAESLGK